MHGLAQQLPVTVSLGEQADLPFAWIDCIVSEVGGQVATLTPRAVLSPRLRERLAAGEPGYMVFELDGAAQALKGMARAVVPGRAIEFLVIEHLEGIISRSTPARADGGEQLLRLMYISQASPELDQSDFDAILEAASRHNVTAGVTGALCLREGFFGQILEGPEPAVRSTYGRIAEDPRHREPVILFEEHADYRLYAGWAMRGIDGESEITAADELAARLALASREDSAELSSRWLRLLRTDSAPAWRSEWLSGRQSVIVLRQLIEQTAPPADAA